MADESSGLPEDGVERLFPWVRLFRAFGASMDMKKLILAALGLLVFHMGRRGFDQFLPQPGPSAMSGILEPTRPMPGVSDELRSAAFRLTEPVRLLVVPFVRIFALDRGWGSFVHALLSAAWGALVWGIVGGAIARIAVVQVARTERVGIVESLGFALRKWLPMVGTPLCPLLGIAFFTAFCAAFGLLYRLPGAVGATLAGIFAVFPLLAGLLMAIIALVLAVGWPLMHATVAAESEDGFDALSRSFAYVNQRPGHYAALTALAWAIGILGLIVVDLFARTTVHMTHWALSFGAPDGVLDALFREGTVPVPGAARAVHAFWLAAVGLLAHGWIYGYFWTSATIIYLLLRHDVDGTPWHAIAAPERRPFEFEPANEPTEGTVVVNETPESASPAESTAPAPDAPAHS